MCSSPMITHGSAQLGMAPAYLFEGVLQFVTSTDCGQLGFLLIAQAGVTLAGDDIS